MRGNGIHSMGELYFTKTRALGAGYKLLNCKNWQWQSYGKSSDLTKILRVYTKGIFRSHFFPYVRMYECPSVWIFAKFNFYVKLNHGKLHVFQMKLAITFAFVISYTHFGFISNKLCRPQGHCILLKEQNASCWCISAVSAVSVGSLQGLKTWLNTDYMWYFMTNYVFIVTWDL